MIQETPAEQLMRLTVGYRISQALNVAATIGIADLLIDGPRDYTDLAITTGTHSPSLYRLLRALAAVNVFHEEPPGRFALTPMAECLRSDTAEPVGPLAVLYCRPENWQPWSYLLHTVRTGENAFRHVHGTDPWEYRSRHVTEQAVFDRAMTGLSHRHTDAIVAAFNFGRFRRIVDVGGGQGRLLASILATCGATMGVLFDQPPVVALAGDLLRDAGVADRCEIVGGSFFETIPAAGDAYVLKTVLHDWGDAEAVAILLACRRAIALDGRLLVIERLLAPPNEGAYLKFLDLQMLIAFGAQERTHEEFRALLDAAGFDLIAVDPGGMGLSVIEGVPR